MTLTFDCPCCGRKIKMILNGSIVEIDDASFNISPDLLKKKIEESGYEFGMKGGE